MFFFACGTDIFSPSSPFWVSANFQSLRRFQDVPRIVNDGRPRFPWCGVCGEQCRRKRRLGFCNVESFQSRFLSMGLVKEVRTVVMPNHFNLTWNFTLFKALQGWMKTSSGDTWNRRPSLGQRQEPFDFRTRLPQGRRECRLLKQDRQLYKPGTND